MNISELSFLELKQVCLKAIELTSKHKNENHDPIMGPSINIVIGNSSPWLIAKALEGLKDDELVSFPISLPFRAQITAKGLSEVESETFKEALELYDYRVSFETPDVHHDSIGILTVYVTDRYLMTIGDPDPIHQNTKTSDLHVFASDRFVSVRDNQEPFDRLEKSLDDIVAEFARDHGKNNSYKSDEARWLTTTIRAVQAQIDEGTVSYKLLRDGLKERLEASQKFFSVLPGIKLLIDEAIKAIRTLLDMF